MTYPTPYADVNQLLDVLRAEMQAVLGESLIGLYLYGSLVWGDFDPVVSDIDLLAAMSVAIDSETALALQALHGSIARRFPTWDDRIEVQYASLEGLRTFKTQASTMANISPGEPFHLIQADIAWQINWYFVRDYGVVLFGPPPSTIIAPISTAEFIASTVNNVIRWREYALDPNDTRGHQAYVILTLCRALHTHVTGLQVSKLRAARWAAAQLPEWAAVIENALLWRHDPNNKQVTGTYPETKAFACGIVGKILGS